MTDETTAEPQNQTDGIRPLIVSDYETVQRFCAPLRHLLFGFEAQGIASCLVVPPGGEIETLLWPGIEIIEYPALKFPLFFRQNRRNLFAKIEKFKPSTVHCIGTARALLAKTISSTCNIPAVLTVNSSHQSFLKNIIIKTGFTSLIMSSSRFVENLKKNNPSIASIIKQVNTGTFVDETCACFSQPQRLPSMVMVSDFLKFDDLDPLLSAVRHLAVDGYEFLIVLMGRGPAEDKLRHFVKSTGLSQTVGISPEIRPLRSVFRGVDIFVQPYITERLDPAMMEAASAGLAIATDKNNADNMLQNNQTAMFFDCRDELSIYSALGKLLDDRQSAVKLACAVQDYLRTNNSVSSMVDKLLKIYSQAAREVSA
ncbi:MAG: glycosyltransferase [Phycisphaerae bacterium]|nr:glycosyltransferase [Phycisphaerae bacterium]